MPFSSVYIDIYVVYIDVGNIARICVAKSMFSNIGIYVANIGVCVGNVQMKRALVTLPYFWVKMGLGIWNHFWLRCFSTLFSLPLGIFRYEERRPLLIRENQLPVNLYFNYLFRRAKRTQGLFRTY